MKIKLLVVEDFEGFRRFIRSMLRQRPEYQITEASDGQEAVQKAKELQPDLVLLDIGLPGLNGIEAAKQIRELAPRAQILFFSQESAPDVVQQTFTVGGRGYVHKARAARDLLCGVEAVLRGEEFVSAGLIPTRLGSLNLESALSHVVAHAIEMASADKGNLQLLNRQTNSLQIVAQSGFSKQFLEFFHDVECCQGSCGTALVRGDRVIVDDVVEDPIFRGTKSQEMVLGDGIRSVQSIPLITSSRQLVGVLSTHFRVPKPSRELFYEVTDSFAQEVAELIQSKTHEVT